MKHIHKGEKSSLNFYRILRSVRHHPGISRTDLARRFRLDKATVSQIISYLIEIHLVFEAESSHVSPGAGRKRTGLFLDGNFGYALGIELQGTRAVIVASDIHGKLLCSRMIVLATDGSNIEANFCRIVADALSFEELRAKTCIGIGTGISGIVDPESGNIRNSIPLGISGGYRFEQIIAPNFNFPIFVENNANCCAWGILSGRKNDRLKNFLFALIRQQDFRKRIGLGLGFVINGTVYYGDNCSAGEFRSLLWQQGNTSQFSLSDREIESVENDGQLKDKLFHEIAKHIALFANTLGFSHIFLGGDFPDEHDELTKIISEEIHRNWMYQTETPCFVSSSGLAELNVAYGASGMILEKLFALPVLTDSFEKQKSMWADIFVLKELKGETGSIKPYIPE